MAEETDGMDHDPQLLERQIEGLRGELSGLVGELDRRRREAVDIPLQIRRHPLSFAAVVLSAAGLIAGIVALRRRRRPTRWDHLRACLIGDAR